MINLKKYKAAILEAVKELLRVVVLAAIPIMINGLNAGKLDWNLVGVACAIAGLRFVDKLLHKVGKAQNNKKVAGGLTRF